MTAYIANHQKKINLFHKREDALRHLIRHGYSIEKIEQAAEKVREAKLGVFKAMFSKDSVLPASKYEPNDEALAWQRKSVQEIIASYQ